MPTVLDYLFGKANTQQMFGRPARSAAGQATALNYSIMPGVAADIDYYNQTRPRFQSAMDEAGNALDYGNLWAMSDMGQRRIMGGAESMGRRNANMLSRTYGSSFGDAAMLDARNRGLTQGADLVSMLYDPMNVYGMAQARAGLYSPNNLLQGYSALSQGIRGAPQKAKSPTLADTALGIVGMGAGAGMFNNLFGGKKK